MPLQTTVDMLKKAQAGCYAVGAFNVENMEMAQAVIRAADTMRAPVIVQTTPGTLRYSSPETFFGIVASLAKYCSVPVAMHLDHGDSFELSKICRDAGYTSLMIDGSLLPYEENITLTRSVVGMADGLPIEAELGTVGGKEDGRGAGCAVYTDPLQALDFVTRTGISSLAVGIGTSHGIYKGEPRLDIDRLSEIRKYVGIPLVLHGTSGVPHEQVRACIERGICKVNYATELRIAFTEGVKSLMCESPDAYDPKKYLSSGRERVFSLVCELISLLGSDGKA